VLEPWGVFGGAGLQLLTAGPDRCPDCGATAGGDGAYCSACGASLEPSVHSSG